MMYLDRYNFLITSFISLSLLIFVSCSQSDEQREFENEAISLPENFTVTGDNGAIIDGQTDPDDWRTAPFFQGLVYINPAYPNPALSNGRINIDVQVVGLDGVSGLRVLAFDNETNLRFLYETPSSPLPPGLTSISINALDIARFDENPTGLYRIILEDREGNIVSFGDVKIE